MAGYSYMRGKGWQASGPTNAVGPVGGPLAEREAMREERLEPLHAGPGEAARQEVAVGERGPAPSRWTLRTIRGSVEWLTEYTVSGVWRGLGARDLGVRAAAARPFFPPPPPPRQRGRACPPPPRPPPHPPPPPGAPPR